MRIAKASLGAAAMSLLPVYPALAQDDGVTVTGTRVERPNLDIPAAIDRVRAEDIRFSHPMINLSESLNRVPGVSVQNRQNYAQDLQISSRGFGGRSTFGVRGLRLVTDGIPASFPDGQGQVSHWDLSSAGRIEVLRGPFSVMYGNASGGVINSITEIPDPGASVDYSLGSFRTSRWGLQYANRSGNLAGVASVSTLHTDGYRLHSAAERNQLNAKLAVALGQGDGLTLVANSFNSPNAQDPLGLTRAQWNADPKQAPAVAYQFDTRKTVGQNQFGATLTHSFSGWTLTATAYAGHRDVRQYLAIPLATQAAPTHSGGVVDLDRDFGGLTARLSRDESLLGRPLTLSLGLDYESMAERRKGFINANGSIAGLKRDEDDLASSSAAYAQAEWRFADKWILLAGLRTNVVAFKAKDYFIAPGNGDDSGAKDYSATTPVAGLLYKIAPTVSMYANAGRGFETPTFAELAYRSAGPGLNFDLQAAKSNHLEVGIKAALANGVRANAALFDVETKNEIATDTNSGGRSTFKNVGRTQRRGLELGGDALLPLGFEALVAWTRLEAKFLDTFNSVANTPSVPVVVPAGSYLPGVPSSTFYGELRWRHAPSGFLASLEAQHRSRLWVDDRNSEAADAYTIYNIAAGFTQQAGAWKFSEYLRVDNFTNRKYVGSVIVNDANLRFYEAAPGRNGVIGLQAKYGF